MSECSQNDKKSTRVDFLIKTLRKVKSIHNYLLSCNKLLFIFLMFMLSAVLTVLFSPLFDLLDASATQAHESPHNLDSRIYEFLKFVIVAPLFETFIFQFLIIETLSYLRIRKITIIFISAFIFSITHYYSIGYIAHAFILGLVLSYSYVIYENRLHSFLIVYMIHLLRNTMAFIVLNLLFI